LNDVDYTSAGWVAHHMERPDNQHTAFAVGCHTPGVVERHRREGQHVGIDLENGQLRREPLHQRCRLFSVFTAP